MPGARMVFSNLIASAVHQNGAPKSAGDPGSI